MPWSPRCSSFHLDIIHKRKAKKVNSYIGCTKGLFESGLMGCIACMAYSVNLEMHNPNWFSGYPKTRPGTGSSHTRFLKTRTGSRFTRFFQPVLQLKPPSGFYRVNTRVYPAGIYPVFYPVPDPTFVPGLHLKKLAVTIR